MSIASTGLERAVEHDAKPKALTKAAKAEAARRRRNKYAQLSPNVVLTHVEAADYIGVHKTTLRRLVASGTGPPMIRLSPRRKGYRKSALDAYLDRDLERSGD